MAIDILVSTLPAWFFYLFFFLFGAIIGSFIDVVVTRFHTGASINGRSRCLSCGKTLSWYELVPLLSYLFLHGRCLSCHSHIPKRLLLMELLTGGLFVVVFSVFGVSWFTVVSLVLTSLLQVITIYDIEHMVIPNELVALVGVTALLSWFLEVGYPLTLTDIYSASIAAVGSFAFYASLWFYSKGRWIGFGDAKLALPLGFVLGPIGAASFVIFSFWIGALVSLFLLLLQRVLQRGQKHLPFLTSPIKMSSEVPFAPFMVAAFLLVYLYKANVLQLMATLLYGSF